MKINKLLLLLVSFAIVGCTNDKTSENSTERKSEEVSSQETPSEKTSSLEESSKDDSTVDDITTDEDSTTEDESTTDDEITISVISDIDSSSSENEIIDVAQTLSSMLNSLDVDPNYTIDVEIRNGEQIEEKSRCEIDGNIFLNTYIGNGVNYYTYHVLNGNVVKKYYELMAGSGKYTMRSEYFPSEVFDSGYFIAYSKYDVINDSLTNVLANNTFTTDAESCSMMAEHIAFKLNLEMAMQNSYSMSGKFDHFAKESYQDYVVDNFTITLTFDGNDVVGFEIDYDYKAMYSSYGNSGIVDFMFTDELKHINLKFYDFDKTSVEKPEGEGLPSD